MSVQWYSKILNRYKRNAIKSDIKTIAHIASNAISEMPIIKFKFCNADYQDRFISRIIKHFNHKANDKDPYIIALKFLEALEKECK